MMKFGSYLGTEQVSHADVYDKYENAYLYLNMIESDGETDGKGEYETSRRRTQCLL